MRPGRLGAASIGIARIPDLASLTDADSVCFDPAGLRAVDTYAGWGRKRSARRAAKLAARRGRAAVQLEDGFLRSFGLGVSGDPPLSLVVDEVGIYYDATAPSELEQLIAQGHFPPEELERARHAAALFRRAKLGKYNAAPAVPLPPQERERVLVVDQTAGDLSLEYGACSASFDAMLEAAIEENRDAEILVRTHPDVYGGHRRGNLVGVAAHPRVTMLTDGRSGAHLLDEVGRVYVMTSHMGFEALLAGRSVTCFGVPWYAGWGLTDDRGAIPTRRGVERSLEQLFAAAYLRYARYVDPETGLPCGVERVIEHLALQRRAAGLAPARHVAVGFSAWKRSFLPPFLRAPGASVEFVADVDAARAQLEPGDVLVRWGARPDEALDALAEARGAAQLRVEDGFLRSIGLGSDLFAPLSLVVDSRGLHYDPSRPSDLEVLLRDATFGPAELGRARALRKRIVRLGVSKYQVGTERAPATAARGRRVALVIGQVEDDASIELGCVDVRTNAGLLAEVREARPGAYVLYRPHPDVVSGNRAGAVAGVEALADEVSVDASLDACLAVASEVHVMTSLVGFEALLRELPVYTYGLPFYAGWGLTHDRHTLERRMRERTIDELVAAVLIRYPSYAHPRSRAHTTPEAVLDELGVGRARARQRPALRLLTKARNLATAIAPRALFGPPPRPPATTPLPDLGVRHALLLQGPAGPFMRRFAEELRAANVRVTKVNFHAGDALFFSGDDAIAYRGRFDDWPRWVDELMVARGIDGVFVFGDCRELHAAATEVARRRDAKVWCFEEGYLRPDWITLEEHGVNGHSRMPRDPEFYRARAATFPDPPVSIGQRMPLMSWYSTLNALAFTNLNQGFPHYRHHRNLNSWYQMVVWCRNVVRKQTNLRREDYLHDVVRGELDGRYFFVPLQVHCDFQLRHSPYDDMLDFVREVVRAFAEHAPRDTSLVVKHHPMDRAYKEYGGFFEELRREHDLGERLIYVHDVHLPTLLKHARGTITINSTVGLSSIHHGTPTLAMGTAVYDMPGLTHQGSLVEFLEGVDVAPPDQALYHAFRRYLLETNQHNGTFYKRLRGLSRGTGIRWKR